MNSLTPEWLQWPQTQSLIAAFAAHPEGLRFVGGAVRDALLGRDVQDVDAATVLLPSETMALLEKYSIRVIPTGVAHGTVTAVIQGKSFEITTLRKDVTTDGRHAEVAFTDDWKMDASRRDFTMNALYLSPSGELFDYFDGVADARQGHVRFIGDANKRISEDFLRILRFFRFYAHYGQGQPDEDALAACATHASYITTLSGERIQHEMFKLLQANEVFPTLEHMQRQQILSYALGIPVSDCSVFARLDAIVEQERLIVPSAIKLACFMLAAAVSHEDATTKLVSRLRLSNHIERLIHLVMMYYTSISPSATLAEQKRLLRKLGMEDFVWALLMSWAGGNEAINVSHPYHEMLNLAEHWQPPAFPVNGNDLMERGIKQGKELGDLLEMLEAQWEDSDYTLSKDALLDSVP